VEVFRRLSPHALRLTAAVSRFEPVWDSLTPAEQARLVHLLVAQVAFDGRKGTLAVTFRPTGIKAFAGQLANRTETKA